MSDNRILEQCARGDPLRFWINREIDANNDTDVNIFTATRACKVTKVSIIADVIEASGATTTVALTRGQGTEAPSAGDVIVAAINVKTGLTADTVSECTVVTTGKINELAVGNRLALDWTNTATELVGVITIEMELL